MLNLSEKQKKALKESDARLNFWIGSVRSGKTYSSIVRWLEFIQEAPPGNLAIVGRTAATIKRNIIDEICNLVGMDARYFIGKSELNLWGRRIYLIPCADERAESKLRGVSLAGVYADELSLLTESFFTMLLSRLSIPGAKLFGTTNPDSPFHYLKRDYIDRAEELDIKMFEFKLDDNPSLTEGFKASLRKEYRGLWYQRYIEGLWVLAEGTIYDFFDPKIHCIEYSASNASYYIVGIDYGTTNPCAYTLIGFNQNAYPNIWVEDEYYYNPAESMRQKTDTEFVEDLIKFIDGKNIYGIYIDPSAASFKAEMSRQGVRNVFDAKNEVLDGIRFTANLISNGTMKICRRCKNLIREMGCYVWDAQAAQRGLEKPVKQNDHLEDSLRYAAFSHFGTKLGTSMDVNDYRTMKNKYYGSGNQLNDSLPHMFK